MVTNSGVGRRRLSTGPDLDHSPTCSIGLCRGVSERGGSRLGEVGEWPRSGSVNAPQHDRRQSVPTSASRAPLSAAGPIHPEIRSCVAATTAVVARPTYRRIPPLRRGDDCGWPDLGHSPTCSIGLCRGVSERGCPGVGEVGEWPRSGSVNTPQHDRRQSVPTSASRPPRSAAGPIHPEIRSCVAATAAVVARPTYCRIRSCLAATTAVGGPGPLTNLVDRCVSERGDPGVGGVSEWSRSGDLGTPQPDRRNQPPAVGSGF
jgi:hypothetical protein